MLNLEVNTLFDQRYLITHRLGEGGMGLVFAAQDTQRGDLPCAIKVLQYHHQEKTHSIRRLTQERSVMAKLRHEHIVEVFDVVASSQSSEHYLVMPLLKGETLNQWIHSQQEADTPVTLGSFLKVICQVLDALHHAHRMEVVHRDLKPDNLFVCREHGLPYMKVLDFGIAKDLTDQDSITAESSNAMIGTPRYMSPEQIQNGEITAQTDLYALGILVYERIAGFHPFETDECRESNPMRGMPTAVQMSWHHINSAPKPIKSLGMFGQLLSSALEKDPQARPKSAHLMCDKIKKWISLNAELTQLPIPLTISEIPMNLSPPRSPSELRRAQLTPSAKRDPSRERQSSSQVSGEMTPYPHQARQARRATPLKKPKPSGDQAAVTEPRWLTFTKWTFRGLLILFIIAWSWSLAGRPHLPIIEPLFSLICDGESRLTRHSLVEIPQSVLGKVILEISFSHQSSDHALEAIEGQYSRPDGDYKVDVSSA